MTLSALCSSLGIPAQSCPSGGFLSGWEFAALVALFVSLLIISFGFALAIGFRLKELEEWTKEELYEVFTSGLIIAVLALAVLFLNDLTSIMAGGDPFALATSYIDIAMADLSLIFATIFGYYYTVTTLSTLQLALFFPIAIPTDISFTTWFLIRSGSFWTIYAGLSAFSSGLFNIIYLVAMSLILISTQRVLLDFFHATMFKIVLPFGILLRTFPITREAGGSIIAIAIGAYLVYPLLLVMNGSIYSAYHPTNPYAFTADIGSFIGQIFNIMGKIVFGFVFGDFFGRWSVQEVIDILTPLIDNFVIISFLFVTDIIILITFITGFSDALGGDEEVLGLSRLI